MQVGEHQHERRAHGQRLEHGEGRPQCLVVGAARIDSGAGDAFEQEQQPLGHPVDLGGLGVGPEHVRRLLAHPAPCGSFSAEGWPSPPDACRSASAIGPNAFGSP